MFCLIHLIFDLKYKENIYSFFEDELMVFQLQDYYQNHTRKLLSFTNIKYQSQLCSID